MMNSLKIRRHLAVLAAASGLALAWADAASAAAFDPAALPGHGPSTAGVVSDIECDPAPGTSGRPSTYRHTKKVKAFKENLNSPARSAIGPIPKASPSAAAKPKPKSTKPVAHRAPRRKPSVMERVRQNCHQIVPPAALEFAGIVPDTGDDLEDVAYPEHVADTGLHLDSLAPCADGICGILGTTPVGTSGSPGGSSSSSGGGYPGGSGSGGGGSGGGGSGSGGSGSGSSGSGSGSGGSGSGSSGSGSGSGGSGGSGSGSGSGSSGSGSGGSGSGSSSSGSGSGGSGSGGSGSGSGSGGSGSGSGSSGSGSGGSGSGSSGAGGAEVPEPGASLLLAMGIAGLVARRRRHQRG